MASPTLRGLVPMAHVEDVARSIEFYHQLGFETRSTLKHRGCSWCGRGSTMESSPYADSRRNGLMNPDALDVLFYLYCFRCCCLPCRRCNARGSQSRSRSAIPCTCPKANSALTIPMATACWSASRTKCRSNS